MSTRNRWIPRVLATIFCLVWALPVYWMVNTAFKPRSEAMTPTPHFIPEHPTLDNFVLLLTRLDMVRNFLNSAVVTSVATLLSVFVNALAGYAFASPAPLPVVAMTSCTGRDIALFAGDGLNDGPALAAAGLELDYSKHVLDRDALDALLQLAEQRAEQLVAGEPPWRRPSRRLS